MVRLDIALHCGHLDVDKNKDQNSMVDVASQLHCSLWVRAYE